MILRGRKNEEKSKIPEDIYNLFFDTRVIDVVRGKDVNASLHTK